MSVQVKGSGTIGGLDQGLNIVGVVTATSFSGAFTGDVTGTASQVTIAGGADNRVVTAASANTLQGESNLTFDGNTLALDSNTGTINVSRNSRTLTLEGNYGNEGHPAIKTSSGHDLRIFTGGNNERLRIDSSGRIGIGENNPTRDIVIKKSGSVQVSMVGATDQSVYLNFGDTDDDNIGAVYYDNPNNRMIIRANTNNAVQVKSNGNMAINDGDLEIGTSGHGISFAAAGNAGGMTSELLDDYEEGSFTPTLVQGYNNITYNTNAGFYTKIGNFVSYSIYFYVQGAGGDNAEIRISLPFTTKNQQYQEEGAYIVYDSNFLSTSNDNKSNCYLMSGRNYTYLRLFKNTNGASIFGNDTLLGTGANNVYLLIKGFLTTA